MDTSTVPKRENYDESYIEGSCGVIGIDLFSSLEGWVLSVRRLWV